jgi:YegS/Rv2252/BmrU family lipid kinase
VIANPSSGGGATGRGWGPVEARLRAVLGPLDVAWTRGPRDAERLAREGVRAGADRLVVAGGDGTLSEVVNGLLSAGLGSYAEIGLLPLGSGGDLAKSLGVPGDLEDALACIAAGKQRRLDAGRARYAQGGREVTSYFVNVASAGVSASITRLVNRGRKLLGGRISFALGTVRGLLRYRSPEVLARLDGELLYQGPAVLVAAANGRYFGGGMPVAPEARPDDGLLDVVVVGAFSRARLLRRLPALYRGTHLGIEGVLHRRGRRLELEAAPGALGLELDGEPLGEAPALLEVMPDAVTLLGPSA